MSAAAFVLLFSFLAGLLFGSFLNVCISRLPQHLSIVSPGSCCPRCAAPIHWYDNIPLLSWVILRARCRNCTQPIPARYPLVELATAFWFATISISTYVRAGNQHNGQVGLYMTERLQGEYFIGASMLVLGFLLLGLLVMDWQTHHLPDAFTWTGIAIAFVLICAQAALLGPNADQVLLSKHHIQLTSPGSSADPGNVFLTGPEALIGGRILATLAAAGILLLVRSLYRALRKREGMGLGDVKLLALIAAFLGFWPAILALFVGVLTATAYAVLLLARRRATALTELPFGSFLALGGLVAALFGDTLINTYRALLQ